MTFRPPESFVFLRSLLLNPKAMGALAPSSGKLSQLMASTVDPAKSSVLEIGAGTGAITRALLERNLHPERLFIIERDPALAAFLCREFPRVRVCCGEAVHLSRILSAESVGRVDTVVSSLPLLNIPAADRMRNVGAMVRALAHGGQLIQYTYGPRCPIPSWRLGLEAECLGHVWLNFPPASVWRFTVKRPLGQFEDHSGKMSEAKLL
jgi:phosphatidylethanolamine/phosphatidyl-N-methylethanolamine N-methyltransferase